jgi:hypothetical protein
MEDHQQVNFQNQIFDLQLVLQEKVKILTLIRITESSLIQTSHLLQHWDLTRQNIMNKFYLLKSQSPSK